MEGIVEKVFVESSLVPVIAITEVGNINSSSALVCGMAIQEKSNKPILKIFNNNGGTVEEEDFSRKESGKKFLVLRNKKTNKVSIFGTKVTYLKKPDYFKLKTYEGQLLDKDQEFNSVFGTKRSLRMSNSRNLDSVNTSQDIFENISSSNTYFDNKVPSSVQNTDSDFREPVFSTDDAEIKKPLSLIGEFSFYLPNNCNRFSNKIENIYPVSTLLSESEIDLMTSYANEVISVIPNINDNSYFTKFFISNINRLSHKTVKNICLLTFADGLIELIKTKSADLNYGNNIIYPNCEVINDMVLDNFVEYNIIGRDLTSKMKDKAVCHIIIILIILNNNMIDLSWVSPFLPSRNQKRLIVLMRVIGATPFKDDKTKYMLKIPLASLPHLQKSSRMRK